MAGMPAHASKLQCKADYMQGGHASTLQGGQASACKPTLIYAWRTSQLMQVLQIETQTLIITHTWPHTEMKLTAEPPLLRPVGHGQLLYSNGHSLLQGLVQSTANDQLKHAAAFITIFAENPRRLSVVDGGRRARSLPCEIMPLLPHASKHLLPPRLNMHIHERDVHVNPAALQLWHPNNGSSTPLKIRAIRRLVRCNIGLQKRYLVLRLNKSANLHWRQSGGRQVCTLRRQRCCPCVHNAVQHLPIGALSGRASSL